MATQAVHEHAHEPAPETELASPGAFSETSHTEEDGLAAYAVQRRDSAASDHLDDDAELDKNDADADATPPPPPPPLSPSPLSSQQREREQENSRPTYRKSDELQAKKEVLAAQSQTHEKCRAQDNELWMRQSGAYQAILNRLLVSKQTASDLHVYLKDRLRRLSTLFQTAASDVKFGENEIGTLHQATVSLELLTKNGEKQFIEAREGVFKQSIAAAATYEKESAKRMVSLRQRTDKLAESVSSCRVVSERSWESYEAAMRESLLLEAEGRELSQDRDPYLLARKYLSDLSALRNVQTTYTTEMKAAVEKFKVEDGRRINALKDILLDHLIAEKTILTNKLKLMDDSLSAVKCIDREKDVAEFVDSCPFLVPDHRGNTTFDVIPGAEDDMLIVERLRSHVVWKGALSRPGKIFKSNWHSGHAVLSLSGFLHWFEQRHDDSPAITIRIRGAAVQQDRDRNPLVFTILAPKQSFFSLSGAPDQFSFRADDEASLGDWVHAVSEAIQRSSLQ